MIFNALVFEKGYSMIAIAAVLSLSSGERADLADIGLFAASGLILSLVLVLSGIDLGSILSACD